MKNILVINAGYEPLHTVTLNHAIKMLVRQVAVIEEHTGEKYGEFHKPRVLRLTRYVQIRWRNTQPVWSKAKVLQRDNYQCGYCGKKATTIDHIKPVSKGGESNFINTVAACFKCNSRKGDGCAENKGMKLKIQPHVPNWVDIISYKTRDSTKI
jgi:5-methylcytosine-specific restriction endonuclease McrA